MVPNREEAIIHELYERSKVDDIINLHNIPSSKMVGGKSLNGMTMEFRLPPIPAKAGLNIFGAVTYLGLTSAIGHISVKDRFFAMPVASDLEFQNISGVTVNNGRAAVPIKTDGSKAAFQVQSASSVSINGSVKNTIGADLFGISLQNDPWLFLFAAIGAFCGLFSVLITLHNNRKRPSNASDQSKIW
jgi:hypothetical protein